MHMVLGFFLQLGLYFSNPIWQSPKKPCVFRPGSDVHQLMCRARFSPYMLSLYSAHVTACMHGGGWTDWNPQQRLMSPTTTGSSGSQTKNPARADTHASAQTHLNSLFIFIAKADSQRYGEAERFHLLFVSPNGNNDQS